MKPISIPVEVVPEKAMYLNMHYGEGTLGKTKFDASFQLPNYALVVTVKGKKYRVSQQDIITAIIDSL